MIKLNNNRLNIPFAKLLLLQSILLLTILLFYGISSHARELYKWTDENGVVHFGDRPQTGNTEKITIKENNDQRSLSASEYEDKRQRDRDKLLKSMHKDRMQRDEEKRKSNAEIKQKQKNCKLAKGELKKYESYGRLFSIDDECEHHFLSQEERLRKMEIARTKIKQWCR